MYTIPGKGGGAVATVATTVTGVTAVTLLPKTGATWINSVALATFGALLVWGLAYLKLRRHA